MHAFASNARRFEDETSTIEVTAACVGLNASTRVFASAVSSPMHGEITSETEDVSLRRDACSDEQNATCGERDVGASSASCFCGGFEYAPGRNYFNTPNKDVYGEFMATGPNGARDGSFGQPDIVRVTVRTSNGWITNPFIAYVNVAQRVRRSERFHRWRRIRADRTDRGEHDIVRTVGRGRHRPRAGLRRERDVGDDVELVREGVGNSRRRRCRSSRRAAPPRTP